MEWPDDTVLWFLEDIKNTPALWDPHDPRYTRQSFKHEAWAKLGAKYKANPTEVKKKWQSLQASYRRERTKVKSGKDSLWFAFQSMSFLGMDTRKCLAAEMTADGDREGSILIEDSDPFDIDIYNPDEVNMYTPTVTLTTPTSGETYNDSQYQTTNENNNRLSLLRMSIGQVTQNGKKRRNSSENNEALIYDRLQEDQFETSGRNVIAKLRILPKTQRILAERLIYDVLLEAELGNLRRTSKLQL